MIRRFSPALAGVAVRGIAALTLFVSVLVTSGSLRAADIAVKAPAQPAAYDWTGIYVGGQVGGAWQSSSFQDPSATMALPICCSYVGYYGVGLGAPNARGSSMLGGIQGGWNYQVGRLVVGGDYDLSATHLGGSTGGAIPGALAGSSSIASESFTTHTDWTATAAATMGWAFDRWLVYSKAGAAFAHDTYSFGFASGSGSFAATGSGLRTGWVVGAGLGWAFSDAWSAKIEYDYLSFPTSSRDFSGMVGGTPTTLNVNSSQNISQAKLELNYKLSRGSSRVRRMAGRDHSA